MTCNLPSRAFLSLLGGLFLILITGVSVWAMTPPNEPGEEFLVNEDVNVVTGLYIREYSLKQDGVVDFKTARQIYIAEYNEYWNTVVHTEEWPLFYWLDLDRDGTFDHFVDQQVSGQPEDIILYLPVSDP